MYIVTNNPKILALYPEAKWVSGEPLDVLSECRKRVHIGYSLVTHPFMGDIHLLANPFRTVILGDKKEKVDILSLRWIEECIEKIHSVPPKSKGIEGLEDYQTIDFELVEAVVKYDGIFENSLEKDLKSR
jgi:hypothetical protein